MHCSKCFQRYQPQVSFYFWDQLKVFQCTMYLLLFFLPLHHVYALHYITMSVFCHFQQRKMALPFSISHHLIIFILSKQRIKLSGKKKKKKKISPLTSKPLRYTRLKHQRAFCILVLCTIWGKTSTNSAMYFGQFSGCFIKKNKINIYKKIIMGKKSLQ